MRHIAGIVFMCLILSASGALAQLSNDINITNAWWHQGTMDGIRIFYAYTSLDYESPEPTFNCRVDYYYDGRIKLVATEGYYHIPDSLVSTVTTFYSLKKPTPGSQDKGYWLVRVSYKNRKLRSGSELQAEPVITPYDLFAKRCVPLLGDLFTQIPEPEVKMWKEQYGSVFDVK